MSLLPSYSHLLLPPPPPPPCFFFETTLSMFEMLDREKTTSEISIFIVLCTQITISLQRGVTLGIFKNLVHFHDRSNIDENVEGR